MQLPAIILRIDETRKRGKVGLADAAANEEYSASSKRRLPHLIATSFSRASMDGLFPRRTFYEFDPSRFLPSAMETPRHRIHGRRASTLRAKVRRDCPRLPGVYGMVNVNGELIYVGKAKSLRARLLSYFRPRSRDPKAGRILRQSRSLVWEVLPSEFAALLRELELIRCWQPRLNVQGQPRRRRRCYVCLGRQPAPYVFLAGRPAARHTACFGPVPACRTARDAVRYLNDLYHLRDCPRAQVMVFADQHELFEAPRTPGCIRHDLGVCLGPCAALCSRGQYAERTRAARAFLEGTETTLLSTIERDMTAAAAALAFERAAGLRDKLESLRWLRERLDRLRQVRAENSFVYPVQGHDGHELWYVIHQGQVKIALSAPRSTEEEHSAACIIEQTCRDRHGGPGPVPVEEMDSVLLVAAWFRRHPEERGRALNPLTTV
jgi:excinuclease ABC subunit C